MWRRQAWQSFENGYRVRRRQWAILVNEFAVIWEMHQILGVNCSALPRVSCRTWSVFCGESYDEESAVDTVLCDNASPLVVTCICVVYDLDVICFPAEKSMICFACLSRNLSAVCVRLSVLNNTWVIHCVGLCFHKL